MESNQIMKALFEVFSREGIDCEEGLEAIRDMIHDETMSRETMSRETPSQMTLKYSHVPNKNGLPPKRQTEHAAGYDLYSPEYVTLPANKRTRVPLGICLEIPKKISGQIVSRSSLALEGVDVKAGLIDPDYRGEITVLFENTNSTPYYIKRGQRIAQIVFREFEVLNVVKVDMLESTDRGEGGFGSTGKVDP